MIASANLSIIDRPFLLNLLVISNIEIVHDCANFKQAVEMIMNVVNLGVHNNYSFSKAGIVVNKYLSYILIVLRFYQWNKYLMQYHNYDSIRRKKKYDTMTRSTAKKNWLTFSKAD